MCSSQLSLLLQWVVAYIVWGMARRPSAADWSGPHTLWRGSTYPSVRAKDDCIMHCSIYSWCQMAVTSGQRITPDVPIPSLSATDASPYIMQSVGRRKRIYCEDAGRRRRWCTQNARRCWVLLMTAISRWISTCCACPDTSVMDAR